MTFGDLEPLHHLTYVGAAVRGPSLAKTQLEGGAFRAPRTDPLPVARLQVVFNRHEPILVRFQECQIVGLLHTEPSHGVAGGCRGLRGDGASHVYVGVNVTPQRRIWPQRQRALCSGRIPCDKQQKQAVVWGSFKEGSVNPTWFTHNHSQRVGFQLLGNIFQRYDNVTLVSSRLSEAQVIYNKVMIKSIWAFLHF